MSRGSSKPSKSHSLAGLVTKREFLAESTPAIMYSCESNNQKTITKKYTSKLTLGRQSINFIPGRSIHMIYNIPLAESQTVVYLEYITPGRQ